jgi:hypothetical protein
MGKWTFFGKTVPERVPITWQTPLSGSAQSALGSKFGFRVAIHQSQLVVDLDVEDPTPDVTTLRNFAVSAVRTITDLVGYQEGCYFDVEIISGVCQETNEWTVFGIQIPVLASRRVNQTSSIDGKVVSAVAHSVPCQMVLADFREAIRVPIGTGFFCYRAIETMMQSMRTSPDEKDSSAWEQLRNILRIDRSAIDEVKRHADLPRHGRPSAIADAERAKVLMLTDEIIKRFMENLVSGHKSPAREEFPVLMGGN